MSMAGTDRGDRINDGKRSMYMSIKTLNKGEIVFKQGDPSPCMYDIHWGTVGIYAN